MGDCIACKHYKYSKSGVWMCESWECEYEEEKPRLFIKVYADSEPSEKAEKMYQITPPHELREIAKHLIEYAESEEK